MTCRILQKKTSSHAVSRKVISYTKCQKCSAREHPQKIRNTNGPEAFFPESSCDLGVSKKKTSCQIQAMSHELYYLHDTSITHHPSHGRAPTHPTGYTAAIQDHDHDLGGGEGCWHGPYIHILYNHIIYVYIIIIIIINNYYYLHYYYIIITIIINIKITLW